jgi:hypothetical protein
MMSVVCSLFEGDYHFGLGALINSLHAGGFRGSVHAGYRGDIPPWAYGRTKAEGQSEVMSVDGISVYFHRLSTHWHLTNCKPTFLLSIWRDYGTDAPALFYFDPDITIKCRWQFFEEWVRAGVAICQDVNAWMPDNHPVRHAWRRLLADDGISFSRSSEMLFNAGFLGISKQHMSFVALWERLIQLIRKKGIDMSTMGSGDRTLAFAFPDQDALNIACMVAEQPISPMAQDAMDLQAGGGGYIMSHAIGNTKPWQSFMIINTLLRAKPPSRGAKGFFRFAKSPIQLFSNLDMFVRVSDLKIASAIGRYIR